MMPDDSPPPPIGAMTASKEYGALASSCPSVALPAMTSGSLYALAMYASGYCAASSATRASRVMTVVSISSAVAPYAITASTLTRAEFCGITTMQRLPVSLHASAVAWPKLPLLAVMIIGCGTDVATLYAARSLKLPVYWNVSLARTTVAPSRSLSRGASMKVVGRRFVGLSVTRNSWRKVRGLVGQLVRSNDNLPQFGGYMCPSPPCPSMRAVQSSGLTERALRSRLSLMNLVLFDQ